jgi:Na+/proline symporter
MIEILSMFCINYLIVLIIGFIFQQNQHANQYKSYHIPNRRAAGAIYFLQNQRYKVSLIIKKRLEPHRE